jgi:hypothetical protein
MQKPISLWKARLRISGSVGAALLFAGLFTGCNRDSQIRVYRLAKDNSTPPAQGAAASEAMPSQANSATGQGRLSWTLPAGWEEKPAGQMRVASFTVSGQDGQTADVSVIPMGSGPTETDLVNMWRQQMRLPAVESAAAAAEAQPVTIGSDQGQLFDIASQEPILDGKSRARILVAMVTRGPTSWFFKMTGEAAFVAGQRPAFEQFLKSVTLPSGMVAEAGVEPMQFDNPHRFLSTNAKESPSENSEKPIWIAPPDWREVPPSQFLLAKFEVGAPEDQTDVSVSMFGGTGGGVLANVNRWRRQLGLEPVDESGLAKLTSSVETDGGTAVFVDLKGTNAKTGSVERMVAAIVPQGGQTWFYKLAGNESTVEKEKETFRKFVQTVKYRNAP